MVGSSSRLASSCGRAVRLHEAAACRVEAARADLRVDRVRAARASDRAARPSPSASASRMPRSSATQAITFECVKCCAGAAHFPDAVVRLAPRSASRCSSSARWNAQSASRDCEPALARLVEGVHHLAEDVELQLAVGGIADAHRLRALVARQPRQIDLRQPPLAGQAVHDLDLRGRAGGGAQQPVAPGAGLVVVAGVHQRQQRQRRVAQPAEAVVPVARPADLLRQRRRRRGDDAAGRRVGQRLQRDQRAR